MRHLRQRAVKTPGRRVAEGGTRGDIIARRKERGVKVVLKFADRFLGMLHAHFDCTAEAMSVLDIEPEVISNQQAQHTQLVI